MKLKEVYKKINNGGREFLLNTSFGMYHIVAVNPQNWTVLAYRKNKWITRTFYCTPETEVKLGGVR